MVTISNKRQISLYIDAETLKKAKERLNNVSKEVEEILRERVILKNPEKFQELKTAVQDLNDKLEKKQEEKEKIEKKIQGIKDRKKQLTRELKEKKEKYQNKKLANGEIYDTAYIKDVYTDGHNIRAYYVEKEQECKECGKTLKQDSILRFHKEDKTFLCTECYEKLNKKEKYGPRGVLQVEL